MTDIDDSVIDSTCSDCGQPTAPDLVHTCSPQAKPSRPPRSGWLTLSDSVASRDLDYIDRVGSWEIRRESFGLAAACAPRWMDEAMAQRAEADALRSRLAAVEADNKRLTDKCLEWLAAWNAQDEELTALRADRERLVEENEALRRGMVEMAIPYEALRADDALASRRWIAPELWDHIVKSTEAARAMLTRRAAIDKARESGA